MNTQHTLFDRIYGPVKLTEPVLIALINSRAMQRLQGVSQHGISALVQITAPVSRFEHSTGAMLLVRRWGGSLEEQIAALLHDVSHTAFSHVIDYVFDGHNDQSYHDRVKETYVAQTDLPAILTRFGYEWRAVLDEKRYSLLEQPAPALCADRLDYFLRDSLDLHLSTPDTIRHVLDHLIVHEGRIMTDNRTENYAVARWLAYTYIAADDASWANFREVGLYEVCAQAIRLGLDRGVITEDDFWGEDIALWRKLHAAADPDLRAQLALVSPATRFIRDDAAPDFRVSTKIRTIDPDVVVDGAARPLSTLDAEFAAYRAAYVARKTGKWPVRVIAPPKH
ncbi:MAG: HD domain-containing protein [Anaerolineae bacterium]|nr:HD domain-containing protein [Anaerolineae bacterium]